MWLSVVRSSRPASIVQSLMIIQCFVIIYAELVREDVVAQNNVTSMKGRIRRNVLHRISFFTLVV